MTNFATLCMLMKPFQMALRRDKKRPVSPSGGDRDSATLQDKAGSHAPAQRSESTKTSRVYSSELTSCVSAAARYE